MEMETPITAERNIENLDLIGKTLVKVIAGEKFPDPNTLALLTVLVAECRVYSTVRDNGSDDGSKFILDGLAKDKQSISDAADAILEDLRNDGINL